MLQAISASACCTRMAQLPAECHAQQAAQPSQGAPLCPSRCTLPQSADLAKASSARLGVWACQPTTTHITARMSVIIQLH